MAFREYGRLDSRFIEVGDGRFAGMDSHVSPDNLGRGMVSSAENARMRSGEIVTRPGNPFINWFYPDNWPYDLDPANAITGDRDNPDYHDMMRSVITNSTPAQTVVGGGSFSNPDGGEFAVILTDKSAWFGSGGSAPFEVDIPGGCPEDHHLEQAFDRLFLFRGKELPVLDYNFARNSWISAGSKTSGIFTLPLPNSDGGLFFQNRLWVHVDDRLYFSDIGDPGRYYYLENEVRVNAGAQDKIEALFPFGKYSLLIFMTNSIFVLSDLHGDVAANMRLQLISSRIGCGAPRSITAVGSQIWFVDQCGHVWDLEQVDTDRTEISGQPRSWPIYPAMVKAGMKNIKNWAGAYNDGYYYLFIEADQSDIAGDLTGQHYSEFSGLNRIAVFDTILGNWVSLDWDLGMTGIGSPMLLNWLGCERLMIADKMSGNLRVIGYGDTDGTRQPRGASDLASGAPTVRVVTRGYFSQRAVEAQFNQLKIQYSRWDSDIKLELLEDGVNEVQLVADDEVNDSNRYNYLNWDSAGAWDPSNAGDDFDAPYRTDYSVYPGTGIALNRGIDLKTFQSYKEVKALNTNANFIQVRITSNSGITKVRDVSVSMRANHNFRGGGQEV